MYDTLRFIERVIYRNPEIDLREYPMIDEAELARLNEAKADMKSKTIQNNPQKPEQKMAFFSA